MEGLASVGDTSDVELLERWARECPDVRDGALQAIGRLDGPPRMIAAIRKIERMPLKPEQARDYELLEARVRGRGGAR